MHLISVTKGLKNCQRLMISVLEVTVLTCCNRVLLSYKSFLMSRFWIILLVGDWFSMMVSSWWCMPIIMVSGFCKSCSWAKGTHLDHFQNCREGHADVWGWNQWCWSFEAGIYMIYTCTFISWANICSNCFGTAFNMHLLFLYAWISSS
jgi:hypothetical protein